MNKFDLYAQEESGNTKSLGGCLWDGETLVLDSIPLHKSMVPLPRYYRLIVDGQYIHPKTIRFPLGVLVDESDTWETWGEKVALRLF